MTDQSRKVLKVLGDTAGEFLQGLVTNDIDNLKDGLVYSALLTPQGKLITDFFLVPTDDGILIDVDASAAAGLLQRLSLYKLRAKIELETTDIPVSRGLDDMPQTAFIDPRNPSLGWRDYSGAPSQTSVNWDDIYVAACIPRFGIELTSDSYILEAGFERLNGVDFRKGCYVGQEVTARMKHKTELRKGLVTVDIVGNAAPGTPIEAGGKAVGTLYTQSGTKAIAYLRFDRATPEMKAGSAQISWSKPDAKE
ncbi:MAG: folate-binding protein [Rhodobacteraceae bacterium]|nr:folate-binding protein [Paracoccaceae bacterium]